MGYDSSQLLEKAASTLENLEKENLSLKTKIASFEKRDKCEKIAKKMIEKGMIHNDVDIFSEKVSELMDSEKLDILEEAVNMNVTALPLGSEDDREKLAGAKGMNPIEALILSEEYEDIY